MINRLLYVSILLVCSIGTVDAYVKPQVHEMKFSAVMDDFANPGKEFRSAPLWVWNTEVSRADIDRMLYDFKEQGFGGAFVHPRPGLATEYLSDEWFSLYRYAVDKGKELGLDIWIYDENSYPSGFAGGHVPAQMPESYNQGQGLALTRSSSIPENADNYFMVLRKDGDVFEDISGNLQDYQDISGDYYLYNKTYYGTSPWHGGFSYVDLLVDGVTDKFIEITMDGYERTFGEELGPVIKGLFSDEPCIPGSGGVRWTPDLFKCFEDRWGYSLSTSLPMLSERTGDWKRVRHNYLQTLTQMFVDRWAKPMSAYCDSKGMLWTGHYWEHDWPSMHQGGDNMAMYAWHQMPAVDMLFNQYNDEAPQAQFGNVRAIKELRSAANQTGAVRTLSETYGGGGWDESFRDFKRLGDWEYALGVNFMNQHLAHMTIVGARKYDYPPVFTRLSPWWDNYKVLNDYFGRLSLVLSAGEQHNDILVIEPTTTIWGYFSFTTGEPYSMEIGNSFQKFVTALEKAQVEYDLGSENIIKDRGSVEKNRFVVGQRAYGTVVIPPLTENIDGPTFKLLKSFVSKGGRLILFSRPTLVDGAYSDELVAMVNSADKNIEYHAELNSPVIESLANNGVIAFSDVDGNDLYHHRRSFDEGELVFLVNSSLTDTIRGHLNVKGRNLLEPDALSGTVYSYAHTRAGDYIEADFTLAPAGSMLLFASNKGKEKYPSRPSMVKDVELLPSSAMEVARMKDNILNIDFCDLEMDGVLETGLYTYTACNKLYNKYYGTNDPWDSAIQYKQTILDRDTLSNGDVKVRYHFTMGADVATDGMKMLVEQPDVWNVCVNGINVRPDGKDRLLDGRMGVYTIGNLAKAGENVVELSLSPMNINAEIAPVHILGDFDLESAGAGWTVVKATATKNGSWKSQGLPFYSWDMSYSKNYDITDVDSGYVLDAGKWNGTVAEVFVNGRKAGVIGWEPNELDITPFIREGRNRVEMRVVGSLKNLFGPHYSSDRGIAGPWHWNNVTGQKPGAEYDLADYGLFDDFKVYRCR